jgi:hypothetical protein
MGTKKKSRISAGLFLNVICKKKAIFYFSKLRTSGKSLFGETQKEKLELPLKGEVFAPVFFILLDNSVKICHKRIYKSPNSQTFDQRN